MPKSKDFSFYWEEPYGKTGKSPRRPRIRLEVPGFSRDEIKVSLTSNSVTVSATKKKHKVEKDRGFYREESSASSFSRSMALPYRINPEGFDVVVSDGFVTLKRKKKKTVEAK